MRIALKWESYPGSAKIIHRYVSDPKIDHAGHPEARPLIQDEVRKTYDSCGGWPEITVLDFDHSLIDNLR